MTEVRCRTTADGDCRYLLFCPQSSVLRLPSVIDTLALVGRKKQVGIDCRILVKAITSGRSLHGNDPSVAEFDLESIQDS
jgi:hypothetical protein